MTADIVAFSENLFLQGFTVFLRVGALMTLLPGLGERSIPVRVRLALSIAFTFVIAPAVPMTALSEFELYALAALSVTETIVGLVLGIGLRAFVFALQIAGSIAAQSTSLSQLVGGNTSDPAPAIGHILVLSGLTLAILAGIHLRVVELVVFSYDVFPMGSLPNAQDLTSWGLAELSFAFSLGFQLAAPFVAISLIYNLTLGVINRAMPQLMVAFVGAPAITAASLILLMLLAPTVLLVWWQAFEGFLDNPYAGHP